MSLDLVVEPAERQAALAARVQGVLQFSERTAEKPHAYAGPPREGVPQTRGE